MNFIYYIILLIYRNIIFPLGTVLTFTIGFIHPKIRKRIQLTNQLKQRNSPAWQGVKSPIWIHAASGEFEYCKPLLPLLKAKFPNTPILVTFSSPTYFKNIDNNLNVDWAEPLPLDGMGPIRSFLSQWKPSILIIARTDLWLEILNQTRLKKIPRVLISATISKSKLNSFFKKNWIKIVYSQLTETHLVSQDDFDHLSKILCNSAMPKMFLTGDTRYDQVTQRLKQKNQLINFELFENIDSKKTLIAGSTWLEDEKVLAFSLPELIKNKKLNLIIAPHEPTENHINDLIKLFDHYEIQCSLFSKLTDSWNPQQSILIVDQVGILADLYKISRFAFVGGSFKKSVHSVMEPLACGCITYVGPFHENNREALEFKNIVISAKINPVVSISDKNSLTENLQKMLDRNDLNEIKNEISQLVLKKSGASNDLIEGLIRRGLLTP